MFPGSNENLDGNSETNCNTEESNIQLQLLAKGNIRIGAKLSERHVIYFLLGTYLNELSWLVIDEKWL